MSSIPFHYFDLRAFCYVTEDDKRVEDALRTFLPEEFEIQRAESAGHYGDRILVLSARVERSREMQTVLDSLGDLGADELDRVQAELDERVNENCAFFLTLDKQAAYNGEVALGDGITLRGKVEAYPAKRESAIENAQEAIEEL
ncbi:RNA-binding protein [Salinibaculum rarum]|uniref:RNA-binding protein n=1 Tax=Salinibaculum rarum TaxID=3058903 RepID=UPI00265F7C67|nr:RNA-binding protein [Salinibaculum sp. KK48]